VRGALPNSSRFALDSVPQCLQCGSTPSRGSTKLKITMSTYPQPHGRWLLDRYAVRLVIDRRWRQRTAYRKINRGKCGAIDGDLISTSRPRSLVSRRQVSEARLPQELGTAARAKLRQWIHYTMSAISRC
jgi:hypothetical protein